VVVAEVVVTGELVVVEVAKVVEVAVDEVAMQEQAELTRLATSPVHAAAAYVGTAAEAVV
jgi:hypothetical protein